MSDISNDIKEQIFTVVKKLPDTENGKHNIAAIRADKQQQTIKELKMFLVNE